MVVFPLKINVADSIFSESFRLEKMLKIIESNH